MAKPKKEKILSNDWTPKPQMFEGEEIEQNLTYSPWRPEVGEKRTFIFQGFKVAHSDEFNRDFYIYHGQDLITGEYFSFVPGGLFDHIMKESNIVTGMRLGVQFTGQIKLKSGMPANQWVIVKLKTPKMIGPEPEHE